MTETAKKLDFMLVSDCHNPKFSKFFSLIWMPKCKHPESIQEMGKTMDLNNLKKAMLERDNSIQNLINDRHDIHQWIF